MKTDKRTTSSVGFEVDGPDRLEGIRDALAEEFALRVQAPRERVRSHLDTFDWRLHRGGRRLAWQAAPRGELIHGPVAPRGEGQRLRLAAAPAFAEDLRSHSGLEAAADLIDVRRLMPVVHVDVSEVRADVLDDESKTVARVYFTERRARSVGATSAARELPPRIELRPVRGYDDGRRVERHLRSLLGEPMRFEDELEEALAALDETFGQDPSRFDLRVARGTPSGRAGRQVLDALFATLLVNEPGTRAALDIEFLHDFRVAVRRTRCILRELKAVFPEAVLDHYGGEFRWLGKVTGRARDLDVLEGSLRVAANKKERRRLEPLLVHLEAERIGEQERMVEALDSPRFRKLKQNWAEFLSTESTNGVYREIAFQPIESIIGLRIRKRYRKLVKQARRGGKGLKDADLHAVRIEGKKLRYAMQLFQSLFDGPRYRAALRQLKELQSLLGDFNDLHVHELMLLDTATELVRAGGDERILEAAASVGARMGKRRKELRGDFRELVQRFRRKDVSREFDRIGAGEEGR